MVVEARGETGGARRRWGHRCRAERWITTGSGGGAPSRLGFGGLTGLWPMAIEVVRAAVGTMVGGGGATSTVGGRRVAGGTEGAACWEEVEVVTGSPREEEVVVGSPQEEVVARKKTTEVGRGSVARGRRS
jgi:hypothetical protein